MQSKKVVAIPEIVSLENQTFFFLVDFLYLFSDPFFKSTWVCRDVCTV